ncbi:MAG TPA: DUF1592 domain-containing protein [Gemmataceae bacterium]|nr:DUF1592 domain-containing protein [Gemmataceae bacterium]
MRFRIVLALCCLGLPVFVLNSALPREPQQPPPGKQIAKDAGTVDFAKDVVPLIEKYCSSCHSGPKSKANLDLSKFKTFEDANKNKQVWGKVAHNLRVGEMPPAGKPRPPLEQIEQITRWMDDTILAVDCTKQRDPGRVTIRRLNRNEYNNTIRDLVGVNFKPAEDFPVDDSGYGFDNIGDVLSMSPLLMEKYLAASEKIVDGVFKSADLKKRIITGKVPAPKATAKEKEAAFKAIMKPFMERAYRRPVLQDEIDRTVRFLTLAEKSGENFEKGVQLGVQATLCSPYFLFRFEKDFKIQGAKTTQPISQYELASRLSYFLWTSMPDEELFKLAAQNKLNDKATLEAQVKRMLKDPKGQALTEHFAGQWLQLRLVHQLSPDPKLFPNFDPKLRDAMVKETELFFDHIVKENRSIMEFLDADWTFVNERLAKHYGMTGIKGDQFQKVKLTGNQRIGVLTHASILSVSSNPTRTSLVKRGKWILDNILNTPPPPPVADAGELSEDEKDISAAPLRQRVELHRANPVCASCHQRMDPLGFGFENYDAIGAWRTKDGKFDIDASGELPNGQKFNGAKELIMVLKARDADFRRCLVEKLLTYGLGRGIEYYDKCAMDEICAEMIRNGDRFETLVLAIVASDPFQMKRGRP